MKIGVPLGGAIPADALVRMVRLAEESGIEALYTNNRLAPFDRDALVRLTLVATNTERALIGAPSLSPFLYSPVAACRAMAQIDELAPGRTYMGWVPGSIVGVSSMGFGDGVRKPMGIIREAVELSRLLLSGSVPVTEEEVRQVPIPDEYKINYRGKHFQLMNNLLLPSRKVPVFISSSSPKMMQLGGEVADGVLTGWFATAGANEWALENIRIGAERAGRSLDDIQIHRAIHMCVWPDRQVAYDTITPISAIVLILLAAYRKHFGIKLPFEKEAGDSMDPKSEAFRHWFSRGRGMAAYSGSTELAREIPIETHLTQVVAGTPDDCIEQLRRTVIHPRFDVLYFALFVPPPEHENWPKALELLMKEVVPALGIPLSAN